MSDRYIGRHPMIVRIILIALFVTAYAYAVESKGYKIVLASFSTFSETKQALGNMKEKMGEDVYTLQAQYHFEIVARPSGKAFILAIEPLKTQSDTDAILKQFQAFYPDAYVNGYYGPTEGSLFLEHSAETSIDTAKPAVEMNIGKQVSEENTTKVFEVKSIDSTVADDSRYTATVILLLIIAVVILYTVWKMIQLRRGRVHASATEFFEEHNAEDRVDMIEALSEAEMISEEKPIILTKIFEPEPDIFYKLKKNQFFITLLEELKEASDNKDASHCDDLVDEVLRYQKNFRKSDKIESMEQLIDTRQFDQLSAFIKREID